MESENMEHMDKTEHEEDCGKNDGLRADERRDILEERLEADACIESTSEEDARTAEEEEEYYLACERRWVFLMLMRADRKFCIFGHCHRNLSMEAGRLLSAAYERLSAGYYGLRNHTKACKADAYHKMGYAFSSHRNDSCNNTGVAARNCAPSDIADNYQFYLRHAV